MEVNQDPGRIFCPSPSCLQVLSKPSSESPLTCQTCSEAVCFDCKSLYHPWTTCQQLQQSQLQEYLKVANVRKCPKCSVRAEADDLCFLATCFSCQNQFCWVCGSQARQHDVTSYLGQDVLCTRFRKQDRSSWEFVLRLIQSLLLVPIFGFGLAFAFVEKYLKLGLYFFRLEESSNSRKVMNKILTILLFAFYFLNFIPICFVFAKVWFLNELILFWNLVKIAWRQWA